MPNAWSKPPSDITKAFNQHAKNIERAVLEVGGYISQLLQNSARDSAPWIDRTGNARAGLRGEVDQVSQYVVEVYLVHSMDYGKWLELSRGGKYAVIWPTIQQHAPQIKRILDGVFGA